MDLGRFEVAIIGAGVSGLACAAYLTHLGVSDVLVLERLPGPGQGSTSKANGGIRAQWSTEVNIAFSKFSISEFERLSAEWDGMPGLVQAGYLFMAGGEDSAEALRRNVLLQNRCGVESRWLTPHEVLEKAPFVRAEGLLGGTFHQKDGFIDPHGAAMTFAKVARRGGARLLYETELLGLTAESLGFVLQVPQGTFRARWVINAAGPDAASVAAQLGVDLPVFPIRRNLALTDPVPWIPAIIPMCIDLDTGVLIRKESGGILIAWSDPNDPPGRETFLDPTFFEKLAERVGNRFPFLETVPIDEKRSWAGLYPETPDHHAILGETPGVPRFLQAVGFGGHGIMHAPATGLSIAEIVTEGRARTLDIRPFRLSRFSEGDLTLETAGL